MLFWMQSIICECPKVRLHPPGSKDDKTTQKWIKAYDKYTKKKRY